ncbi:acyl-ACP--UDP-N-acetylglucosamine O-acyltransferase [Gluconobacter cerinus]|uniref:Acyl-[acyl-carrier-protein]--UDP-N-acetylglucosamine O-acyltransferase n=1 Tax=Gluconobacter cerinus TaxID=38307 RepID=A0A1B6VM95_9PROT|nr:MULTISPECIES: acyl-ACP--UDP-N-acetylglucosamine O-acyltransferase [Gluconobacter]MBM3098215.1 acyl-ACP--UDP-N-acetylglucosamine O-acyltransferase [Gluconobacter cerinus]MBS0981902.1 acyl-ACP--UDP-N-acetylglucosamine O-acyltransferase [Gluconobacter cerinus]MBS0993881.1 acyl-ACP--UDP-N-acetylglucosamine O-acyltransferase [Gluconobacter cerinus]MBS1017725.1 acyl-ACP--UDP-N-acetylglucosamine O-acyltransferase [Gluconobacter cerinus]MBS1020879.1 acyl-ACP--UDP-N-acetylglucosamine O-acyltransfera
MQIAGKRSDSAEIHATALVDERARIGENVRIGPWCIVGPHVTLGDGVHLHASVIVDGHTTLREEVEVYPFVTIGMAPQDLKYAGEPTLCEIGAKTIIRENVTIHRGTAQGHALTKIGASCLIMANAHVAHDCVLGDRVIIVNNVVMGGHVEIADDAKVMGSAALHQFVRIGRGAVVGGVCGVEMDVIPYGSVLGNRARLVGLNWIGLKRSGVGPEEMQAMRRAFRTLYPRHGSTDVVLEARLADVRREYGHLQRIAEMLDFMEAPSRRGLTRVARNEGLSETEGA